MGVWRKRPYPKYLNRWDIHGDQVIENESLKLHREEVFEMWVPPSEDPHYQKKWLYWKSLFAKES